MAHFPVFIDLKNEPILVVGGGKVATRKVKTLLSFSPKITLISPTITEELRDLESQNQIVFFSREFNFDDLEGKKMVILAVDQMELEGKIFQLCEYKKILCNSAHGSKFCNFIFPSVIRRGDLSIGISTSGTVPSFSKEIRKFLEKKLPSKLGDLLKELANLRETLPKGQQRQAKIRSQTKKWLEFLE